MKTRFTQLFGGLMVFTLTALMLVPGAGCSSKAQREAKLLQADPAKSAQKQFDSPEEAIDALLAAFKDGNDEVLLDIFGHDHERLIVVSDKVARVEALTQISEGAEEYHALEPGEDGAKVLIIGEREWPFPIPLVESEGSWAFDTDAGAEEIINRRIGRGELNAIEICELYVAAQLEYAAQDRDGDRVHEYAQRLGSTPGNRDGLFWEVDFDSGEELSPFGPLIADAAPYVAAAKASDDKRIPFHGYYFKILKQQGSSPPGGKYNYVINGNMIAGFAMVAWPADYDSSGIMTFVISHHGDVYEKDLGEKTAKLASKMTRYDPDDTWTQIEGN